MKGYVIIKKGGKKLRALALTRPSKFSCGGYLVLRSYTSIQDIARDAIIYETFISADIDRDKYLDTSKNETKETLKIMELEVEVKLGKEVNSNEETQNR